MLMQYLQFCDATTVRPPRCSARLYRVRRTEVARRSNRSRVTTQFFNQTYFGKIGGAIAIPECGEIIGKGTASPIPTS